MIESHKGKGKMCLSSFFYDFAVFYEFQIWVDSVEKARKRAKKFNIDLEVIRADQNLGTIKIDEGKGLEITFLNPINFGTATSPRLKYFGGEGSTVNGNSVSVLIKYNKAKILLCGDLNKKAEDLLLSHSKKTALKAHVFKANHHGSEDFTFLVCY